LPSFSPKAGENFYGTLLSLAFFCHSANILAMIFSKPNFPCRARGRGASASLSSAPGESFLCDPGGYEGIIAHPLIQIIEASEYQNDKAT
jgi:hypothetical protein